MTDGPFEIGDRVASLSSSSQGPPLGLRGLVRQSCPCLSSLALLQVLLASATQLGCLMKGQSQAVRSAICRARTSLRCRWLASMMKHARFCSMRCSLEATTCRAGEDLQHVSYLACLNPVMQTHS